MNIYTYLYIYMYTHIQIYAYIHTFIHLYIYMCTYICIYTHIHTHIRYRSPQPQLHTLNLNPQTLNLQPQTHLICQHERHPQQSVIEVWVSTCLFIHPFPLVSPQVSFPLLLFLPLFRSLSLSQNQTTRWRRRSSDTHMGWLRLVGSLKF